MFKKKSGRASPAPGNSTSKGKQPRKAPAPAAPSPLLSPLQAQLQVQLQAQLQAGAQLAPAGTAAGGAEEHLFFNSITFGRSLEQEGRAGPSLNPLQRCAAWAI